MFCSMFGACSCTGVQGIASRRRDFIGTCMVPGSFWSSLYREIHEYLQHVKLPDDRNH